MSYTQKYSMRADRFSFGKGEGYNTDNLIVKTHTHSRRKRIIGGGRAVRGSWMQSRPSKLLVNMRTALVYW